MVKDVDIKYKMQPFDGRFMEENIYRQNASKEVDEAWEALGVDCTSLPFPRRLLLTRQIARASFRTKTD